MSSWRSTPLTLRLLAIVLVPVLGSAPTGGPARAQSPEYRSPSDIPIADEGSRDAGDNPALGLTGGSRHPQPPRPDPVHVPRTWFVATTGSDLNFGSAARPFATIQRAIDAASYADRIVVACGVYRGPGNRDIDFLGKSVEVTSATGDWGCCTIDCEGTPQDPHSGFIFRSGELDKSIVSGFTITGATTTESGGGGVFVQRTPVPGRPTSTDEFRSYLESQKTQVVLGPVIRGCFFDKNDGVGVLVVGRGPGAIIDGCRFELNTEAGIELDNWTYGVRIHSTRICECGRGARIAVYSDGRDIPCEIRDCLFSRNAAEGLLINVNPEGWTKAAIRSSRFADNGGDGIRSCHAVTLMDVRLRGNGGCGMVARGTGYPYIVDILDSEIRDNAGHGMESHQVGRFRMERSEVTGNGGWGARIDDGLHGDNLLETVLIAGNDAGGVEILDCGSGDPTLAFRGTTIADNLGPAMGFTSAGGALQVTLERAILSGNQVSCAFGGTPPTFDPTCVDIHGNVDGDWLPEIAGFLGSAGNFSADPLFCDPEAGNWLLAADSPCAPGNHPDGETCGRIGARDVGCEASPGMARKTLGAAAGKTGGSGQSGQQDGLAGDEDVLTGARAASGACLRVCDAAPNPFRAETVISYELTASIAVRAAIHDSQGRVVRLLKVESAEAPGRHELIWNGRDEQGRLVAAGVYFCHVEIPGKVETRRIILGR
ncbi:MAG: right-handed parallel beta-helix repeat-containing protein [Candidatus Eisenbacteria bacterium]